MPKKPTDYSRAVIYKIEHNENKELVYVGSTTDFTKRKSQHKTNCNNENNACFNYKVYNMIRENGGWESFQMLEVKKFPCNDSREARAEEERCRVELKATLNMKKAFGADTIQEYKKIWYEENIDKKREQDKKRYQENKDTFLEKQRIYTEENRDVINEKHKAKREENKDFYKERDRKYYQENKAKINERRRALAKEKKLLKVG